MVETCETMSQYTWSAADVERFYGLGENWIAGNVISNPDFIPHKKESDGTIRFSPIEIIEWVGFGCPAMHLYRAWRDKKPVLSYQSAPDLTPGRGHHDYLYMMRLWRRVPFRKQIVINKFLEKLIELNAWPDEERDRDRGWSLTSKGFKRKRKPRGA